ncbi:MAG: DUF3473 domain-containing protein [Balneolaceae bacterium]|nr:DUF3473 domain-containing protein [Balneolaceae bacterium]
MNQNFLSAFTVDVECGISITMRDAYGIEMKPTERVIVNTSKILELLENKETKATFFVLGIVAEHYPKLVKEIAEGGHEIGVHGYHHLEFSNISEEKAFQEIDRAKKLLEDITGNQVYGHRAPAFSINEQTRWGLDVIARAGFAYDSSIMPIQSGRYGWPGFQKGITELTTTNGDTLIEVPLSTTKLFGKEIPACGGRYLQILPYKFTKNALIKVSKKRSPVFYMHPYEIDETPYPDYYHDQLRKADFKKKMMTYIKWFNRGSYFKKIDKLTSEFRFGPMIDIVNKFQATKR